MSSDSSKTSGPPARILFVDHTAELSGGELALLNLARHLDREKYESAVVLFSDGPLVAKLAEAGIETHLLPLSPAVTGARKDGLGWRSLLRIGDVGRTVLHVLRLARLIRRQRADLVHTNSLKADIIGGLAARLARRPVVWHIHDRIESPYLPEKVAKVFRRLARWIPAAVIVNSHSTLATLRLPAKVPAAVAPPGLNAEYAGVATHSVRATRSAPIVGIAGRIAPWKGQHIFLQAAAKVKAELPDARFMIIGGALFGEQAYEHSLHDLVRSLGLDEAIEFTGHRADVRELMTRLDVLVHASTSPEPFGQVITEAMGLGTPVVASDGGGVREIITDGRTGLLVPMGDAQATADAVLRLLQNPQLASALASTAKVTVMQRFGIGVTVERVCRLYHSILIERLGAAATAVSPAATTAGEVSLTASLAKQGSH